MALMDVSDVLLDPDFQDHLVCERRPIEVGDDGRATNSTTLHRFFGVVTSDSGDALERQATGQRVNGSITITTQFRLSNGGPDMDADIVQCRDRRYTVTTVNDYAHFGHGFVAASCELIPLSG